MTNFNGDDNCILGDPCANCPSSHPQCDPSVGLCSAIDGSSTVGNISKPNERSCLIFLEKLFSFPHMTPFFWTVAKLYFSNFSKSYLIFFSMKLTICELFFLMNSAVKKIRKFFTDEFIEKKNSTFFWKIQKKLSCHKKSLPVGNRIMLKMVWFIELVSWYDDLESYSRRSE